MPLSKRKRLFTPKKGVNTRLKSGIKDSDEQYVDNEVSTARGRLKGALMEMIEPAADESDASSDYMPAKRDRPHTSPKLSLWYQKTRRHNVSERKNQSSDDEGRSEKHRKTPPRQSYVLKLFDRSVDLSQFSEDSPLYPICRAWIANQPKANYSDFTKERQEEPPPEDSIDLPGPEGPVITCIPSLLPEQKACNKDNINLNYQDAPLPSREELLRQHMSRWCSVRDAWQRQNALVETRYSGTQIVLNNMIHGPEE